MRQASKEEIINEFRKSSSEFIPFLLEEKLLKGDIRKILCDYIIGHPNRPWSKEFSWIPLMPSLLSVDFVTGKCNLRCRMCGGGKGTLKYVDFAHMREILKHAVTLDAIALPSVDSEPFLNPDFIKIMDLLKSEALTLHLVSNAQLLNDEIIGCLLEYPCQIDFNVSIDAASDKTYKEIRGASFSKLIEKLELLASYRESKGNTRFRPHLTMVGMSDNISELPDLVKLAARLNFIGVKLSHLDGDYFPGDFTANPEWSCFVERALLMARDLNVNLTIPKDSESILKRNPTVELSKHIPSPESSSSDAKKMGSVSRKTISIKEPAQKKFICANLYDTVITFDGGIYPCCYLRGHCLSSQSIYDVPLHENREYLAARKSLAEGIFFDSCYKAVNCGTMQKMRP